MRKMSWCSLPVRAALRGLQTIALATALCGAAHAALVFRDSTSTPSIAVIDSTSNTVTGTIGSLAQGGMAVPPAGDKLVTVSGTTLSIFSTGTKALLNTVTLSKLGHNPVISADGRFVYVLLDLSDGGSNLGVVDLATNTQIKEIPLSLGGDAVGLSRTFDGKKIIVFDDNGPIQVLDANTLAVLARVAPPGNGLSASTTSSVSPNIYVADFDGNFGVVDTSNYSSRSLDIPAVVSLAAMTVSVDEKSLFLSSGFNKWAIVDLTTLATTANGTFSASTTILTTAVAIAPTADKKFAYFLAREMLRTDPLRPNSRVYVLDLASNTLLATSFPFTGEVAHLVTAPVTPPVSSTSFAKYTTELLVAPKLKAYSVAASFTLATSAAAISPTTQNLTLTIGTLSITVPAGMIKQPSPKIGLYTYDGVINGEKFGLVLTGQKSGPWGLVAVGSHAFTSLTTSVPVTLTIETNTGTATIKPVIASQVLTLQ
ncbi:hypothetical protein NOV72_04994 [Caballeronia novacaledonica]|uniref:YVTN beta-propeller repeat-containing protein n=2 Tax=Caballeronia novacaledonica TaxID=1544861 RepID=A0A2U3IC64_9BURK|nr:hypothetical protein NOV72_04994 [Caballeronia novacaledonica]